MIVPTKLYNGQVELLFNEFKHAYFVEDLSIPSVTQVLSVINKPALIQWAANMAVEHIAKELKPGVAYDELQIKTMLDLARKAHSAKKTAAGDIGTFVHNWISDYIKGNNPEVPYNEQLKQSVTQFMEWQKQYNVTFLLSEQPIFSQKFAYAGTLDFIGKIDGKLILGDIKTSTGIWDEYWFQTAAYKLAREEEFPQEQYAYRGIIRIGKAGEFEWQISDNLAYERHVEAFLACRSLYGVLDSMKKVKEPTLVSSKPIVET